MKNGFLSATLVACTLIYSMPLLAADSEQIASNVTELATIISAEPLVRKAPRYPLKAARSKREGWVRISYVVDTEGKVKDAIVHDSSGTRAFEKAALKAINNWTFEPATLDGKPIEQCNSLVQLDFKLSGNNKGVTRKFLRRYKEFREVLADGRLEQADKLYLELKDEPQMNFAESTHFAVVSAMYFDAKKQMPELVKELKTINRVGHNYLSEDTYTNLSYRLYRILAKQNKISEAYNVINNVNEHFPGAESSVAINELHSQVSSKVKDAESLVVAGIINGDKPWFHQLHFNQFDLISEDQPLDRIELRCKNKRSTYGNVEEQGFKIPESWGQCVIYIDAPADTEFTVAEYRS